VELASCPCERERNADNAEGRREETSTEVPPLKREEIRSYNANTVSEKVCPGSF
jgi:hypothetical protein